MGHGSTLELDQPDRKASAIQRPLNVPVLLWHLAILLGIASAYLAGNTVILACYVALASLSLAVSIRRQRSAQPQS